MGPVNSAQDPLNSTLCLLNACIKKKEKEKKKRNHTDANAKSKHILSIIPRFTQYPSLRFLFFEKARFSGFMSH